MSQRGDSDKKPRVGRPPRSSSEKKKAEEKGTRKKTRHDHFGTFINRILKNVHSDVGITKNGMKIMDSFAKDILEKIALEAGTLCKYQKHQTLSTFHVIGAIKLVLPPEISQHAIEEGKRAYDALGAQGKKTSHK